MQPEIGQNTVEILRELNYSDKKIQELVENKIVHQCHTEGKL